MTIDAPTTRAWRKRIVGHADVPPKELVPNRHSCQAHPAEQQRALSGALAEVGWVAEVLVNRTTGRVVDAHLPIELARSRDEPTVLVTYVELTEEEALLVLASSDPIGAMAEAEALALEPPLADLEPADADNPAELASLTSGGCWTAGWPSSAGHSSETPTSSECIGNGSIAALHQSSASMATAKRR